jgi:fructose/tagatose bisphosphate aldolase
VKLAISRAEDEIVSEDELYTKPEKLRICKTHKCRPFCASVGNNHGVVKEKISFSASI